MTTDQLEHDLRAADPTGPDDHIPSIATVLRATTAALAAAPPAPASPARGRRRWTAVVAVAAAAAVLAVAVPLLDSGRTPTAQAAIRLAPFDGLLTPFVLTAPPAGLVPQADGRDGVTSIAYVPPAAGDDAVWVTHSREEDTGGATDEPHAQVRTHLADGSWLTVAGYGRYADDTVLGPLAATAAVAPRSAAVGVDVAPAGWRLAGFKGAGDVARVLTISPGGQPDDADAITVIRYPTTAADFPAGYMDQGPTSPLSSLGRAGILMQGRESWTLQLRLPDGGSLVLLLPARMDRDQVHRFADGVTVPAT